MGAKGRRPLEVTYLNLRAALIYYFPEEATPLIEELEAQELDTGGTVEGLSAYTYMSEVYFRGLLTPSIEQDDDDLFHRCLDFAEQILASNDPDLNECFQIRVSQKIYANAFWVASIRSHAGERWKRALFQLDGDAAWLQP
jgi:hypothetical protein